MQALRKDIPKNVFEDLSSLHLLIRNEFSEETRKKEVDEKRKAVMQDSMIPVLAFSKHCN